MKDKPDFKASTAETDRWSEISGNLYKPKDSGNPPASNEKQAEDNSNAGSSDKSSLPQSTKTADASDQTPEKIATTSGVSSDRLPLTLRLKLSEVGPIERQLGDAKEYTLKGFSYDGKHTWQERLEALKQFKSPVDYKELLKNAKRVAMFGETHPDVEVREELAAHMKEFKELGFTHLAMEALPSSRQGLIDDYYAGKATREQVLEAIKKDWGWAPESYMKLIDAAKENGVKVVCLDIKTTKEQEDAWKKNGDYLGDSRFREQHWLEVMSKVLESDPKARIMGLAGAGHTGINAQDKDKFTSKLEKAGYKATVIDFATDSESSAFGKAVKEAGLSDERFSIPVVNEGPFRPADFFVHLRGGSGGFPFHKRDRPDFRDERKGTSPYYPKQPTYKDDPNQRLPLPYRFQLR